MPRHTSALRPKVKRPREAGLMRAAEKRRATERRNAKSTKDTTKRADA